MEDARKNIETQIQGSLSELESAEKAADDVIAKEAANAVSLASAEASASASEVAAEAGLRNAWASTRKTVIDARGSSDVAQVQAQADGKSVVSAAQIAAYSLSFIRRTVTNEEDITITEG